MPTTVSSAPVLPSLAAQAERLTSLGVSGLDPAAFEDFTAEGDALLVVRPELLAASALAPLLRFGGKPGFVVSDMTDVDTFGAVESATPPDAPVYVVTSLDRGDAMRNWSPYEALPAILDAGRTPLTLTEGLHWVLQKPEILQRGRCFMTIGSRVRKPDGSWDSRTPALWISNGTGRDGIERRDAAKVGWCWAGNRHTWLGFASAGGRHTPRQA